MRTVLLPLVFLCTSTLLACSLSLGAGTNPRSAPSAGQPASTVAPAQPASTLDRAGGVTRIGKRPTGPTPAPSTTTTAPGPLPTAPPTGAPIVAGATIFGSGNVDPNGYKGSLYWLAAGTTRLPTLSGMTPSGFVFTHDLNIAPQAFTTGFPGVGANSTNFALRYEAPLVVTTEADYDFRLVADDGAVLRIDNTPIVDNDGVKAAAAEKTGPVHLVAGTHLVTVDYFQTVGNVALQLFCKRVGDTDRICPTRL